MTSNLFLGLPDCLRGVFRIISMRVAIADLIRFHLALILALIDQGLFELEPVSPLQIFVASALRNTLYVLFYNVKGVIKI